MEKKQLYIKLALLINQKLYEEQQISYQMYQVTLEKLLKDGDS